jgi:prephenate dehydrogenase
VSSSHTRTKGLVRVVGTGLLGTSVGLALSKLGIEVSLADASPANLKLAIDYGAGRQASVDDQPNLIVVCVPPDITANTVINEMRNFSQAVVTDVASVKGSVLEAIEAAAVNMPELNKHLYVGSHPMAGRERGGAIAGRADLFIGRPWVISPSTYSANSSVQMVENLALDLGAAPTTFAADDHDRAVALVSHLPQVISSLLAARLNTAVGNDITLAGQGLRDTARIAASDPKLWIQILGANSARINAVLRDFGKDLDSVIAALDDIEAPGALTALSRVLEAGNRGVERIPGKHGANAARYATVVVMIDDKPGELARLLTEIGQIGVNLEDLKLEHSPGAAIGLPELYVAPEAEEKLINALTERGWRIAG